MMDQEQRFCPNCEQNVLAARPAVNHLLHFFLCIPTALLWLFVWAAIGLFEMGREGYRCQICGQADLKKVKQWVKHEVPDGSR